jgi:hypothetical protein
MIRVKLAGLAGRSHGRRDDMAQLCQRFRLRRCFWKRGTEALGGDNDRNRDTGCDQSILDRRRRRFGVEPFTAALLTAAGDGGLQVPLSNLSPILGAPVGLGGAVLAGVVP